MSLSTADMSPLPDDVRDAIENSDPSGSDSDAEPYWAQVRLISKLGKIILMVSGADEAHSGAGHGYMRQGRLKHGLMSGRRGRDISWG